MKEANTYQEQILAQSLCILLAHFSNILKNHFSHLIDQIEKENTEVQSKFVQQIPYFRLLASFMKTEGELPGSANWMVEPYLLFIISCLLEVSTKYQLNSWKVKN